MAYANSVVHMYGSILKCSQPNTLHSIGPMSNAMGTSICVQWNISNSDALGTEESVLISEVS